ncbi:hypothetical protein PIB30_067712 [Stylosanthes scabra]|uniref:Uncharacterized protein n=1 Tax=Stylosanthes scabra TaxID=79078 RepID=A0ABU6RMW6_9FABA|nr:hypothetical protein [Stylosanthes scabra]
MRRLTTRNPTLLGTSPNMVFHLRIPVRTDETATRRRQQLGNGGFLLATVTTDGGFLPRRRQQHQRWQQFGSVVTEQRGDSDGGFDDGNSSFITVLSPFDGEPWWTTPNRRCHPLLPSVPFDSLSRPVNQRHRR